MRDLFDFEKWAPRSSQAWRLGNYPASSRQPATSSITDDDIDILNKRLKVSRDSISSSDDVGEDQPPKNDDVILDGSNADDHLAESLNARIYEVARASGGDGDVTDRQPLTGSTLSTLLYTKYGKRYDVGFVRRDIPGKTLISLNIYHAHLSQRSFPMTQEEYDDKLDGVALYLEAWGQAQTVVAFLKSPIAPRRGLPSRPVVGNAVSIGLELSREQIDEWFGRR